MVGAGTGAVAGGPPGAMIGDLVADALFQQGKSGAVKVRISPTEKIVLSPSGASANRGLLTRFLKAKATGQTSAMVSAFNALKTGDDQSSTESGQPTPSSGGSLGAILSGGRL
jgi:hypothetical protein